MNSSRETSSAELALVGSLIGTERVGLGSTRDLTKSAKDQDADGQSGLARRSPNRRQKVANVVP